MQDSQLATPAHGAVVIGAGAVAAAVHHFADAGKMVMAVIIGVAFLAVLIALFNRWRQGHTVNLDALSAAVQQMKPRMPQPPRRMPPQWPRQPRKKNQLPQNKPL